MRFGYTKVTGVERSIEYVETAVSLAGTLPNTETDVPTKIQSLICDHVQGVGAHTGEREFKNGSWITRNGDGSVVVSRLHWLS